jgi:tetratricopeptide (TPR) repeat protein
MKKVISVVMVCLFALSAFAQKGMEQVDAKKLKLLEKAYTSAKAAYTKKPKDAKVKKIYTDATVSYGMGCMYAVELRPQVKYKMALQYFRETLKVDPKNKLAKENKEMIESIYKQMNRPVPGGN